MIFGFREIFDYHYEIHHANHRYSSRRHLAEELKALDMSPSELARKITYQRIALRRS
jgi:hypothetical protein